MREVPRYVFKVPAQDKLEKGKQVYLGEMKEKNEAWLRDMLFETRRSFPPMTLTLLLGHWCRYAKSFALMPDKSTPYFINERGRLTIVECKLWKNPQARREVVAQAALCFGVLQLVICRRTKTSSRCRGSAR